MDEITPHQLITTALDAMHQAMNMLSGGDHQAAFSGIQKASNLLSIVVPSLSDIVTTTTEQPSDTIVYAPQVLDVSGMLQPIPGDNPAGINVRLSGEVNSLLAYVVNRTKAADFRPQYSDLIVKAVQLLKERSKDLGVAVRCIEAAVDESGFAAIADGLLLINGLFSNFWDGLYPECEDGDCEARANELAKLEELLLIRLAARFGPPHEFTPSCSDLASAEKESAVFKFMMEQFDILNRITQERFDDQAPDISELQSFLRSYQNRIDAQLNTFSQALQQEQDATRWEREQAIAAASEAVDRETEKQSVSDKPPDGAVISLEPKDLDDAFSRMDLCARFLIEKCPQDPLGYLVNRSRKWFNAVNNSSSGVLSEEQRQKIIDAFSSQQWDEVLSGAETAFMNGGHRWIDLQRFQALAAQELGNEYESIARVIVANVIDYVAADRGILEEKMDDGTPCATPETIEWIRMGIANRGNPDAGGFGGKTYSFFASEIERANDLASNGKSSAGMSLLHSRLQQSACRREQFLWRIVLAEYCLKNSLTEISMAAIDHLVETVDKLNLADWEDPELFVRVYKAGYSACRSLGEKKVPQEKLSYFYRRICLFDPKHTISSDS
ncbi:MAG TPA: type VI secretion system domain-containing protein [Chitinispirillaceae bacterium]|nr:type VI secretion system domain-containing protein [Chitinispirillaceae bacterium]